MSRPTSILLLFLLVLMIAWLSLQAIYRHASANRPIDTPVESSINVAYKEKATLKASRAKAFAEQHGYNTKFCFLADMSMPSGQNRFFVYDLRNDSVANAGLVTHGRCNQNWLDGRKYGNTIGCGCTSLGKYKIGNAYTGRFGLAFKLYGLENTNDKAFSRFVVLHSHACVPEKQINNDICQSDGCPTVSPGFLQNLKSIITASKKPVLLWIYE